MAENSSYVMDLYCDHSDCSHDSEEFPHTFYGETRGECKRDALLYGWQWSRNRGLLCPQCSKKPNLLKLKK